MFLLRAIGPIYQMEIFFIDGNNNDTENTFEDRLSIYSNNGICFSKEFF